MKQELCCLINPYVLCDACNGGWCQRCWTDRPGENGNWGPNKYAGHLDLKANGLADFLCGNVKVRSNYREHMTIPLTLRLIE